MKVKAGTPFLTSGEVFARLVLPSGMRVKLDVTRILPDVLIFDGALSEALPPPPPPLPDPLPDRAFGRIRPEDWIVSECVQDASQHQGSSFIISATFLDVPLEVLPGREKEFSNFVSKVSEHFPLSCFQTLTICQVIFSPDGAIAGILGSTAVGVTVTGLNPSNDSDGAIELNGIPFQGSVHVQKGGFI
jgi:hypothetical protein